VKGKAQRIHAGAPASGPAYLSSALATAPAPWSSTWILATTDLSFLRRWPIEFIDKIRRPSTLEESKAVNARDELQVLGVRTAERGLTPLRRPKWTSRRPSKSPPDKVYRPLIPFDGREEPRQTLFFCYPAAPLRPDLSLVLTVATHPSSQAYLRIQPCAGIHPHVARAAKVY